MEHTIYKKDFYDKAKPTKRAYLRFQKEDNELDIVFCQEIVRDYFCNEDSDDRALDAIAQVVISDPVFHKIIEQHFEEPFERAYAELYIKPESFGFKDYRS